MDKEMRMLNQLSLSVWFPLGFKVRESKETELIENTQRKITFN